MPEKPPAFVTLPTGERVHRSVLPESPDSLQALDAKRAAHWASGRGMPPLPLAADGTQIGPQTASEARRLEDSWWQRHMWSKGGTNTPPPDPLADRTGDERRLVTEQLVSAEMNRLIAERGQAFGQAATRALRRDAVAACAAKVHEAELKGGQVHGWVAEAAHVAGAHRCAKCGASAGVMRRADRSWSCPRCVDN